jgi:hypothetical protein
VVCVEITAVAEAVVPALRPFISLLFRIGEATVDRGVDEIANHIDAKGWPLAKALWARLRHRVADDQALNQATAQVAADPADAAAQGTLRQQLERVLATDPSLQRELAHLLTASTQPQRISNTAHEINIGVQGSIHGGTVTATGKQADQHP